MYCSYIIVLKRGYIVKLNLDIPLHSLTPKELEILRFVHDRGELVCSMSIQTFAEQTHYSTSTILRFCRKLGFSGYPELKYYLRSSLKKQQEEAVVLPSSHQIFHQICSDIITDLEGTTGLLNTDNLIFIAKHLSRGVPIYLHEPGGVTDITVRYLESVLFLSGFRNVYLSNSSNMTRHLIQTAAEDSIFIFISSSGNFGNTLNVAREARMHGMIVISISSIENNDLAEISNYNLRFFAKNRHSLGADITSRLCTFFVLSQAIEYFVSYQRGTQKTDTDETVTPHILMTMDDSTFTPTEKAIADYLRENAGRLSYISLNDICETLYVSNASIVRFAQKLGYRGYNDLKFSLRAAENSLHTIEGPWNTVHHNFVLLQDFMETLQADMFENVCRLISERKSIYIYGRNMSSIPARYLYSMLTTMDIRCIMIDWFDFLIPLSRSFPEHALLFVFANYAEKSVYDPIITECHNRNVTIVWISSSPVDPDLIGPEDICICTSEVKIQDVNLRTKMNSMLVTQIIIEYLHICNGKQED